MKKIKLFVWRQSSTGRLYAALAFNKFEATSALVSTVGLAEHDAVDFDLVAEGNEEAHEFLIGEFGGVFVLCDTVEV